MADGEFFGPPSLFDQHFCPIETKVGQHRAITVTK